MSENYLLRSVFFVPGHVEKYLGKIESLGADAYILDVEDSVPADKKELARRRVNDYLEADTSKRQYVARINEIASFQLIDDLEAVMHERLLAVMPSKIRSLEELRFIDGLLAQFEAKKGLVPGSTKLLPLIETLAAFLDIKNIVAASDRLIGLAFGGEDYLTELQGEHGPNDHTFDYPRTRIAIAAKSAGVQALDTPFLNVRNHDGFKAREQKSRDLGYDGCLLIHPAQVEAAHEVFSPSEEEIQRAMETQNAVNESRSNGLSVVLLRGELVGPPMQKKAERVLRTAELMRAAAAV